MKYLDGSVHEGKYKDGKPYQETLKYPDGTTAVDFSRGTDLSDDVARSTSLAQLSLTVYPGTIEAAAAIGPDKNDKEDDEDTCSVNSWEFGEDN